MPAPAGFEDLAVGGAPAGFEDLAVPSKDTPIGNHPVSRYASRLVQNLNPLPMAEFAKDVGMSVLGPSSERMDAAKRVGSTASNLANQHLDLFKQGWEALKAGKYGTAFQKGVHGSIPLFGLSMDRATEEYLKGNTPEALAEVTALMAPSAAGKLAGKTVGPLVKNVNNPTIQNSLNYLESQGVPLSAGQSTGSKFLQRVEQGLQSFPGSSRKISEFYGKQEQALSDVGTKLANKPTANLPTSMRGAQGSVDAGFAVQDQLKRHIAVVRSSADKLYDELRTSMRKNKQQLSITTPSAPRQSAIVDESGRPYTITPPPNVRSFTVESPVDLKPIQAQITPLFEELQRTMPIARQQASPSFAILRDIMTRTDEASVMGAMDFDKALGAIKAVTRNGSNPYLSTQAQGIAKQVIKSGEEQLSKALPVPLQQKLFDARHQVRRYHEAGELLADLSDEPAALYRNLVAGGDNTFQTLNNVNRIAPDAVKLVGKNFLEGLIDKATKEGGFGRSAGIAADWRRLGPKTKEMMFGKQLTGELDQFMTAAKQITTNLNPSGSANSVAALHSAGALGSALTSFLTGHPGLGAAAVGEAFVLPRVLAEALLTPGGTRMLTKQMVIPSGRSAAIGGVVGSQVGRAYNQSQDQQKPKQGQQSGLTPPPR